MLKKSTFFTILFFFVLPIFSVFAKQTPVLFIGQGCPHCAKVKAFLKENNIKVPTKEIYFDKTNRELFLQAIKNCKIPQSQAGVPLLQIDKNHCIVGDEPIIAYFKNQLKKQTATPKEDKTKSSSFPLTLLAVISAALVDAINPCAFAVLILLLSTILLKKDAKQVLWAGLSFSTAIFLSYFAMGLGIYKALATYKTTQALKYLLAFLAFLIGALNLKDYFFYGGLGFKMEVPESWRPALKKLIQSVTSPLGAFVIAFGVSLFLLPCTSGPYIVILAMLSHKTTFSKALLYLVLYNFVFILPMLTITFIVYKGLNPKKLEELRQKNLKRLHLIAGILMITLGALLLI